MASSTIACVRMCSQGHIDGYHSEQRVFFDDAARLVLVPRPSKIEAYDLPTEDGFDPHRNRKCWEVRVDNLDQFISIQISLDANTLAVHRSNRIIEFVDRATGNLFVQGCSNAKRDILGCFFVESSDYDLVMVTDTAVELYNFTSEKREGLKMVERMRQKIKWYLYTYATRVLLLGTGQSGSRVTGYQFTVSQMIKLPFVDLEQATTAFIDPDAMVTAAAVRTKPTTSPVTTSDVVLLRLYNRVFFCHIDRRKKLLKFYLVFMDTLMLAREYEMYNDALSFNVVDNVLLVHHTNSSVVAVFDLAAPSSLPIGSPLPVSAEMFRMPGRAGTSGESEIPLSTAAAPAKLQNIKSFNHEWRFFQPDLVIDDNGNIYRFQLDLEGVVTSYSDPAPLIGFLNRRRVAWVPSAHPRTLLVSSLRSVIRQTHSIHVMREVFCMLHYDGSETVYPSNTDKITPAALKLQTPMLKSKDLMNDVFKYLLNEDVMKTDHLEMCLIECMRSADKKKIPHDPAAYVVWSDMLIKQKKFFQLQQMLNGLKEAQIVPVAQHLERLGGHGMYVELGLETFGHCAVRESKWTDSNAMELYCAALLKHGKVIKAMRVAQRHRVVSLRANQFLDAAVASKKEDVIMAVKRFITEQNIL